MKKICVLGNYSGRNAGDAAILGCLLEDISTRYTDIFFEIPSINPKFIHESYKEYNIKPVSILPWNFSLKIFGLPVFRSVLDADLILVTDAILFDRRLHNPLFNYLWTLSHILPRARERSIPIVLYNCSLGPIKTRRGRACLEKVLACADIIILRDQISKELLGREDLSHSNVVEGADCALNSKPVDDDCFLEICKKEHLFENGTPAVGFNICSYIDVYVHENGETFGRSNLVSLYAQTVGKVIDTFDVDIIFIETQHMDRRIANEVIKRIRNYKRLRMISNRNYNYREICAVMKRLELFVGMRTHSLIFASSMGIPPVGIETYPKNRGFMQAISMEKNLIKFSDLSVETLFQIIDFAYKERENIKKKMTPLVEKEKAKAKKSTELLQEFL